MYAIRSYYDITGIPYFDIVKASVAPALIFVAGLLFIVDAYGFLFIPFLDISGEGDIIGWVPGEAQKEFVRNDFLLDSSIRNEKAGPTEEVPGVTRSRLLPFGTLVAVGRRSVQGE